MKKLFNSPAKYPMKFEKGSEQPAFFVISQIIASDNNVLKTPVNPYLNA
jgi:hypothetical protein